MFSTSSTRQLLGGITESSKGHPEEVGRRSIVVVVVVVAVSHIQRIGCQPETTTLLLRVFYTVANPARGLLNSEKRTKEKVRQHTTPPTPHTVRSEKNKLIKKSRDASIGATQVSVGLASVRGYLRLVD